MTKGSRTNNTVGKRASRSQSFDEDAENAPRIDRLVRSGALRVANKAIGVRDYRNCSTHQGPQFSFTTSSKRSIEMGLQMKARAPLH